MEIKKTMVDVLAFVTAHGNMSEGNLDTFVQNFCVKTSRTASGTPRENVKLFDVEGNVLGRKCSASSKWMSGEGFNGDVAKMSICREANKLKTTAQREANTIKRDAESLVDDARNAETPTEKLEFFELYDVEMTKAKSIIDSVDYSEVEGFDTIDDLAADLEVDVITSAPKVEVEEEVEEVE